MQTGTYTMLFRYAFRCPLPHFLFTKLAIHLHSYAARLNNDDDGDDNDEDVDHHHDDVCSTIMSTCNRTITIKCFDNACKGLYKRPYCILYMQQGHYPDEGKPKSKCQYRIVICLLTCLKGRNEDTISVLM